MIRSTSRLLVASVVVSALGLAGCDVGGVGGDDEGAGDDTGGDGDGFVRPDAGPDPVQCASKYQGAGDLSHEIAPVIGESCDAAGTWTITLSGPTADEDGHDLCSDAPSEQSFTINVTATERDPQTNQAIGYAATDAEDTSRVWEVSVSDKGGSCSGSFVAELDGGVVWSTHVTENGPDGPTAGQGSYEVHN